MVQFLRLLDVSPSDILPQRPPFVMIDRLTRYDENSASTSFVVRDGGMFVVKGKMLATGLVENMAQTCAARLGYFNLISGQPVKIGFIGAVSNFHTDRMPHAGEELHTSIHVKEEIFGMTLADAEIRIGGEIIATAELKIAIRQ